MNNTKCILCSCPLTDDAKTKEHILPNAIGGKQATQNLICSTCNSTTGHSWDAVLAERLKMLRVFYRLKFDRKNTPSIKLPTTTGEEIVLHSDGHMTPAQTAPVLVGNQIKIKTGTVKEAKKHIKGLKRKYPNAQFPDSIKLKKSYFPIDANIEIDLSGHDVGRSLVKSMLALLAEDGNSLWECAPALSYLKGGSPCFGWYYSPHDLVLSRQETIPFHSVSVRGSNKEQALFGYIEYFGTYRALACLSETYTGSDFQKTYSIDPTSGSPLKLDINLDITKKLVFETYDYLHCDPAIPQNAQNKLIEHAEKAHAWQEAKKVTDEILNSALQECNFPNNIPSSQSDFKLLHSTVEREAQKVCNNAELSFTPESVLGAVTPNRLLHGSRLREGLTLSDLSKKTHYEEWELAQMEAGQLPITKETAEILAEILNTDYRNFL